MKKKIILSIAGIVFLIAAFIIGSIAVEYHSSGEGTEETVTIEIEQGEGSWEIAGRLKDAGLIHYRIAFFLKARSMGASSKLRYGTFTLHKESGLQTVIEDLTNGGALKEEKMFTVPEGYTIELIGKKLEKEEICTEDEFLAAVQEEYDYWFLEDLPKDAKVTYRLQGFLFPETYAISEEMTARDIVTVMLEQFDTTFTEKMQEQMNVSGKNVYEIVTEASIIERETMIDSERATVAGVIKNRLEKGMRLEMCPTALYPLTKGIYDKTTVTYEDTKVDSPYNTYVNKGLPAGPIANPGFASLEAALNPEEHGYFYYHTNPDKNDGSHIFTKTYEEHIATQ